MKIRLLNLWQNLHESYWFIPSVMALVAIALSFALVDLDRSLDSTPASAITWLYRGGAEGARTVLSTVASSIITVAGVVFSVTITALSLASSQFGPRLLRGFINDRGNQLVLGTFIATHAYCLLVLRTVRGQDDADFVPHLAVTVGIVMAMASLGVLIYFIHHVAHSIQAPNVIAAVAVDLHALIDDIFLENPEATRPGAPAEEPALPDDFDQRAAPVLVRHSGYVRVVDVDVFVEIARSRGLIFRLAFRPGQMLSEGRPLLAAYPAERIDEKLTEEVNGAVVVGAQRTVLGDVEFAVEQLVEIAVRALSPGINDPFTAMTCVDYLANALRHIARRAVPSPYHLDGEGALRVVTEAITLPDLIEAGFGPIRRYGRSSVIVTAHLFDALTRVVEGVHRDDELDALAHQIEAVAQETRGETNTEHDRATLDGSHRAAHQALTLRRAQLRALDPAPRRLRE